MASISMQLPMGSRKTTDKSPSAFISTRRWSEVDTTEGSSAGTSPTTSLPPEIVSNSGSEVTDTPNGHVFSLNLLLGFRASLSPENDSVRPAVCQAKLPPPTYETLPSSKSKVVAPVRHHQAVQPLSPTAGSWGAQQRSNSGSPRKDDNEKVARTARSILNKITAETFDPLFEQLVTCGIEKPEHISKLMSEVFDTATKQHHFIPMYADLCVKLEQDPRISMVVEVAGRQHNFRRLLLNQCQVIFEQLLEPCDAELALDDEVCVQRKQEALGNIKLIGHLLVNGMLTSKMLVECGEELISKRAACPEALESLAALMMVAGPTFDTTEWQYHDKLHACFVTMRKLSKDKTTVPRSRFLLRDVLDVREAGWPTSVKNSAVIHAESQRISNASALESIMPEGILQKPATKLDILSMAAAAPAPVQNFEQSRKERGATHDTGAVGIEKSKPLDDNAAGVQGGSFDLKAFRRTLAAILSDLTSNRNVSAAVKRVRLENVPVDCQADQFSDLITRIVEEKRGPPRRCAMAFAVGLAAAEQSAFDREQCLAGLVSFFRDVYPDLCDEVPRLPAIVRSELTPTFCSVFPSTEINSRLPPGVRF